MNDKVFDRWAALIGGLIIETVGDVLISRFIGLELEKTGSCRVWAQFKMGFFVFVSWRR